MMVKSIIPKKRMSRGLNYKNLKLIFSEVYSYNLKNKEESTINAINSF
jgi:hypothetical protein